MAYYGAPPYGGAPPAYAGPPAGPYGAAPGYGGPPAYPGYGGPAGGYGAGAGYGGADEIRTIFITGFPEDVKERELNNLMRFVPRYQASQMTWKNGIAQGFALFDTAQSALNACNLIAGVQFDENSTLRCEMARKNMFTKDEPAMPGAKRPRFGGPPASGGGVGGSGGNNTFSIITANDGAPIVPVQPTGFAPVTNLNDNPPCSTLFVGNLGDNVSEQELRGLFAVQPGFKQLKIVRSARSTTSFIEFDDVGSAIAVHTSLQGAILPSSDRGGIRIQYSKNPLGVKRKDF